MDIWILDLFRISDLGFRVFKFYVVVLIFAFYILNFIGCVSVPTIVPTAPEGIPGAYHRVEKGQTLWKISKSYNIDLDDLIRINHITDVTNIEIGQLLFIPRRQKQQVPLTQSALEDFIWPIRGKVITAFGQTCDHLVNKGINIQADNNTDVVASRGGQVVFYSPDFKGYGKTIIIDHGDSFLTVYTQNSQVFTKLGDFVSKGTVIAKVGSSENIADKNAYLHFEIRKGYIPQNPCYYLPR